MNAFFKKIAFLFFVFGFQIIGAQNSIVLDTKEAGTTTNFDFEIGFNNTDEVSALQFDISYNENVLELATGHSLSTRASNHTLAVSHPAEGVIRVILYSSNNEAIQGSSGVLATLKLKTKTLPGNFSLSTTNLVASLADQTAVEVTANVGSLKVLGSILQIANPNINFGRVPLGSSTQRSLSVQNTGTTDLILTGVNAISPFSIQQSFPITISPNTSQNLTVTINTANKYKDSETLIFQNNDADALRSQTSVNLEAEVYAVNEIKIGSGNGEINTEIEIPVVIENMEPFNGFQFDIQLPNDIIYVENSVVTSNRLEDHSISASVVNGNILRFLAYSPTNKDFKQTAGEVFSFKLKPNVSSGTYQLRIQNAILTHTTLGNILSDAYNGAIRINSPNLYINPSNINYNNVPITETRNTVIRLTNFGNAQLNINDIIFDATELSLDVAAPIIIEAGQSKNVNLTFNPSSSGSFSETIAFRHNAANTQNIVNISAQKFSPNYLKVNDQQAKFNTTNLIEISLENNDDIKAAQFDVQLPEGFVLDLNAINTMNRASQFTAAASNVSGNTYRVVLYSASGNTIAKGTGAIMQLPITLQNSVNAGNYSFSFSDVILSDGNNNNTSSIALEQGVITVVEEGSVQVTLAPNAINSLGGQWRISGGDWQNSGATLSELEVGNYTIEFKEVVNWNKPEDKNITISRNQLIEITGTYADPDSPTVVISSDASNPTNNTFTAIFIFSEDVTGFTIDDISATNATVSNFTSSSTSIYTALISPTTNGVIALNIAEGAAQDAANNGNNASDQFSITYDNTKPKVEISSTASDPTNTSFTATFTFSEDVSGFTVDDISATNATLSDFSLISSSVYTVLVTPTSDGLVTLNIAKEVTQDAANNGNNAADQFSITYDGTKPNVEIISTINSPTQYPFTAKIIFSESVSGFTIDDILLANAISSNFEEISAKEYSILITPLKVGTVKIDINAGIAIDIAGNSNESANQFSISYIEQGDLSVTLTPSVINSLGGQWRLSGGEWQESGETLENLNAGEYIIEFKEVTNWNKPEDKSISITNNKLTQIIGVYKDPNKPTAIINSDANNPTNTSFTATFTFSEEVTGFEVGDIILNNATISNFSSSSGKVYTALITPITDGKVTIGVKGDIAVDAAGNLNNPTEQYSIIYDNTKPTIIISSNVNSTTQNPFTTTFIFSENVSGFTESDITLTNAISNNFIEVSPKEYKVLITPLSVGNVSIDINDGVTQDTAGNTNESASQFTVAYVEKGSIQVNLAPSVINSLGGQWRISGGEWQNSGISLNNIDAGDYTIEYKAVPNWNTPSNKLISIINNELTQVTGVYNDPYKPTVLINSDYNGITNSIFTAVFIFSEDVSGFEIGDITVSNATVSNFSATSGSVYSALITPSMDGEITIDVNANVAQDTAGNGNNAADQFSIIYDGIKPTVEISSTVSAPTNTSFTANFTFSEEVTGFELGDIILNNATISNFTSSSGKIYTALIMPISDGEVAIEVNGEVAQDAAGNKNLASDQFSLIFDATKPTVEISSTADSPTNTLFTATFTFSEDVTGFEIGDIIVDNATISNFSSSSSKNYSATITPIVDGEVTINVNASVAQDTAGNFNNAAEQFSVVYDGTLNLDIYNKVDFQIYPNPVNQEINISSDFEINKIELYSMNGKKILSLNHSKLIDVTNLASGTYFVRIYFLKNGIVTKKIFKK